MNDTLKRYARTKKVYLYEVAARLKMLPAQFSVQYMRHRLTEEETALLTATIDEIAKEKEEAHEEESKAV